MESATDSGTNSSTKGGKSIEERYKKKTQIEHVLLRSDTYVGSTEYNTQQLWVFDETTQRMQLKNVTFVPALIKIFDEILVNAADVKARQANEKDTKSEEYEAITCIRVDISKEDGTISVYNNGDAIPIEIHKEHNVYVPELIFGQLLTSDNYDDTENRVTGGRNGYGAKLTNIFSTQFTVECGDAIRKRRFRLTWSDNMTKKGKATIKDYSSESFVRISYKPDLAKFGMTSFDDDFLALVTKRVYDIAGTSNVKVYLNNKKIAIKDFKGYVDLYLPKEVSADNFVKVYEKQWRWEVVICNTDGNQFQQVSFVNSISTPKGGSHVNYVLDQLIQSVVKKANSKNRGGMEIKATHVKNHFWIFLNCLIVNPSFDSQTKETLTTKPAKFGSKCILSDKTINLICKSCILENVVMWAQTKQQVELKRQMKTGGTRGKDRVTGIPKLEDANLAGGKHASLCTLILTEGDSAKTSCLAGLSVVGRDRYGVFPLKGKLLNVRDASFNQLKENKEIQNIMKVMGLQITDKAETPKGLRYGSLMIMTDQDYDGSHIKGLLINFIDHYWPNLLKCNGFLKEFVTPIVKVSKGQRELAFFTMPEYEEWKENVQNIRAWRIKYYKGLGTSTDREFKEYFSKLDAHQLSFKWEGAQDNEAIDMAFSKKRAEDRKAWIQGYEEGTHVDHNMKELTFYEFVNKELVLFSRYDTERSVPCIVDGLKPGQRKVLYAVFKRNLKEECKVAQLAGYISEHAAYHHGEASLQQTIVAMAQRFVGSNNINYLEPCGQFGSRSEGGKDASAPRYIFTKLAACTRLMFCESDEPILRYRDDDGQRIEPTFYVPVIPTILVNGAEGIGTGWSCSIPNYNPKDIIANIKRYFSDQPLQPMTPWFRHFKGRIEPNGKNGYDTIGVIQKVDDETVEILELPIRKWTQDYREWLDDNVAKDSRDALFEEFTDNSSLEDIHITVKLTKEKLKKAEEDGLIKFFKLRSSIPTSNMTLFDEAGKVQRYENELEILKEFINVRLAAYKKRKAYLIAKLEREKAILDNRMRFILMVINGELIVNNKKKKDLVEELYRRGFDTFTEINKAATETEIAFEATEVTDTTRTNVSDDNELGIKGNDYDYLLGMQIWSLTAEKVEELRRQHTEKEVELLKMRNASIESLWLADVDALEAAIDKDEEIDAKQKADSRKFTTASKQRLKSEMSKVLTKGKQQKRNAANGGSAKKKKKDETESEQSISDSETDDESELSIGSDDDENASDKNHRTAKRKQVDVLNGGPSSSSIGSETTDSTKPPFGNGVASMRQVSATPTKTTKRGRPPVKALITSGVSDSSSTTKTKEILNNKSTKNQSFMDHINVVTATSSAKEGAAPQTNSSGTSSSKTIASYFTANREGSSNQKEASLGMERLSLTERMRHFRERNEAGKKPVQLTLEDIFGQTKTASTIALEAREKESSGNELTPKDDASDSKPRGSSLAGDDSDGEELSTTNRNPTNASNKKRNLSEKSSERVVSSGAPSKKRKSKLISDSSDSEDDGRDPSEDAASISEKDKETSKESFSRPKRQRTSVKYVNSADSEESEAYLVSDDDASASEDDD